MSLEKKYHTGVIWQDFQHSELVTHFLKLKQAREDKENKDAFRFAVAFLSMYVHHHFKLEEEYMDIYQYPETESHTREHKSFIKKLKEFRATHREYSEEALDRLLKEINEWIFSHIFEEDKNLGAFILEAEQ